ncbi:DegT/DnrJ/EryC1/StrS family aminotransferase [Paenibacillus sp. RC67]|uniref:DegT/DnrJ/EryC1/StrS family aminotransferase n=1 Tax=Paenibacillus sp. RC67 TaxID=3039392 RepID=UPI0024AE6A1C|nr:DegT/DnrJ/EryC1/StrS family aminotransferase [Paenibacillus sp. RC67]
MGNFYPVALPILNGNEKKYVLDCLDSTWISSNGSYIKKFEQGFAELCTTKHALACSNGTTALHLALLAHGVGPEDEVIVPTFTFIATANAVTYCKAKPVFVDSEPDTWNIDPAKIEQKITPRTKGIIAVHLYGHSADMDPILEIANRHGLFVIEDAAEAIGAQYKERMVGSLGHTAIFSLFGNKILTTGEGGMITTNDESIAKQIALLKGQGMDPKRRYWYPVIGYNYRMTNIQAAIGCAQLEQAEWHIDRRIQVAGQYYENLKDCEFITLPTEKEWAKNVYWMFSAVFHSFTEEQRDEVMQRLYQLGIETRPFFYPMHKLPPYQHLQPASEFPVSNRICSQGINLPSYGSLTSEDIQYISANLKQVVTQVHEAK